jgi:uroporphyrinogen decarboxylase
MTPRERMLTAYRRGIPDRVPISPELWDATAIAVSGRPFHELVGPFADVPWWQTHLAAFEYFGADAWILAMPGETEGQRALRTKESAFLDDETIETRTTYHTSRGDLRAVSRTTPVYEDWLIEHPVKIFPRDMRAYEDYLFSDPRTAGLSAIDEVIDGVGQKGLVTPVLGDLFTSFLGTVRAGGIGQTLFDLVDEPDYCAELHERYRDFLCDRARAILARTRAQALFIHGGYSGVPIFSPALFRRWDQPILAAVTAVCREYDVPLHVHLHGHTMVLMDDLIDAGVSLVCPLLPPPQGDVSDLASVKRRFGDRIALKGNVDPFTVLLHGTPADVDQAVAQCVRDAAAGGGFILGTADSTLIGTPFENIRAFVDAGWKYGDQY